MIVAATPWQQLVRNPKNRELNSCKPLEASNLLFVLIILHGSFTVNQKRGHMGPGFRWSLAIRQRKSTLYSKHKLGCPPHAWAYSHAEAESTRNSMRPAVNVQPVCHCSSVAWQTLTHLVTTAWASASSAPWPRGHHTRCSQRRDPCSAGTAGFYRPLALHLYITLSKQASSAAGAQVCFKHHYSDRQWLWAFMSRCPSATPALALQHSREKSRCKLLPFTIGLPPTLME